MQRRPRKNDGGIFVPSFSSFISLSLLFQFCTTLLVPPPNYHGRCVAFEVGSVAIAYNGRRRRRGNIGHRRFVLSHTINNTMKDNEAMEFDPIDNPQLEQALTAARMDPQAVVLSLWPSAIPIVVERDTTTTQPKDEKEDTTASQIKVGRNYLHECGYTILYEASVDIPVEVATLLVLALYWGEEWLRTNCWYHEQPLEDLGIGLRQPTGAWPGATWKTELCFRQQQPPTAAQTTPAKAKASTMRMHVFVATTSIHDPNQETNPDKNSHSRKHRGFLWSKKYAIRAKMAYNTGHAGNSCMHLTDDQSTILQQHPAHTRTGGQSGRDCNASYAVACARCLLNPYALKFLQHQCSKNSTTTPEDYLQSHDFLNTFENFCTWLGDRTYEDIVEEKIPNEDDVTTHKNDRKTHWNRPPPF